MNVNGQVVPPAIPAFVRVSWTLETAPGIASVYVACTKRASMEYQGGASSVLFSDNSPCPAFTVKLQSPQSLVFSIPVAVQTAYSPRRRGHPRRHARLHFLCDQACQHTAIPATKWAC